MQQSSSEIFVSQLKKVNNSWEIVSSKENKLDSLINEFYEYLSSSGPATGTSLVALNLNASNKTEVIVCHEIRDEEANEAFLNHFGTHFKYSKIPRKKLHPEYCNDLVQLIIGKKKGGRNRKIMVVSLLELRSNI